MVVIHKVAEVLTALQIEHKVHPLTLFKNFLKTLMRGSPRVE